MSGVMHTIHGHRGVHVLSEQDGAWHIWHGERYFCNLKATQTRSTQLHSVGMQFCNTTSTFLSQCVLNKIMETIKVVGVPDSPRLPFQCVCEHAGDQVIVPGGNSGGSAIV